MRLSSLLVLFVLFVPAPLPAQTLSVSLAEQGLRHLPKSKVVKQRPKRNVWQKVNPIGYVLDAGILTYQVLFSEQLQANCQYEISCSEFTLRCIRKYGALRGLVMGFNQMQNCHRGSIYEHEVIQLNPQHKVKNGARFQVE